jgi:hypothetical protein
MTDRMDSVSASLIDRMDSVSANLTEKVESLSAGISEKLDRFPTKLQLSLWACAGLITLLGVTASMIAVLFRIAGMHDAAAIVNAVNGK